MDVWVLQFDEPFSNSVAVFTDLQKAKECASRELNNAKIEWKSYNNGDGWRGVATYTHRFSKTPHTLNVLIYRHTIDQYAR